VPVPPPVPRPVPVPARCNPDGTLTRDATTCQVGLPECTRPVAVYLVDWLDPGDTVPGVWSRCGQKMIEDATGSLLSAATIADAMRAGPGWYNDYLRPYLTPLLDAAGGIINAEGSGTSSIQLSS